MEDPGLRGQRRTIVLLSCVLGLNAADAASIGATAVQLEHDLGIGHTQLGLLVAVSTGVSAIATLPFGWLADRTHRVRLLAAAIAVWSLAMVICGAASSYEMLLLARLGLGAISAAGPPVVASLTGDLFPAADRGRVYGYVLTGELVGAGAGLMVAGEVAGLASWRWALWTLAVPGWILAVLVWRMLPEPARGARELLDESGNVEVSEGRNLLAAVRYLLSIPTNRSLILSSALGYFFFSGVRTFALLLARSRFGLGQGSGTALLVMVGLGGVVGVLITGRLSDRLIARGSKSARPAVAGVSVLVAVAFFAPGLLLPALAPALVLFFAGAAGVGGTNPPIDSARLDIVHFALWGRAEGVRSTIRSVGEASAPPLFGLVATWFGGSSGSENPTPAEGRALAYAFLVMLLPLLASGLLLFLRARRTYPADVAAARSFERETRALAKQRLSGDHA